MGRIDSAFPSNFKPLDGEDPPDFVRRAEALRLLNIKPETLYTYVSRGLIRSVSLDNSKARGFSRGDIERLLARSRSYSGKLPRAGLAMHWGEPIITTRITEVTAEGARYRGQSARNLAESGVDFESVCQLLWRGMVANNDASWAPAVTINPDPIVAAIDFGTPAAEPLMLCSTLLLAQGLSKQKLVGSNQQRLGAASIQVLQILAGACGYLAPPYRFVPPACGEPLARMIARALDIPFDDARGQAINAALILCADLELAPSTFVARVAASAGADLYSCVAAGINAHAGVLTGLSCNRVEELLRDRAGEPLDDRIAKLMSLGRRAFGFNHPLFPKGDPRAVTMIEIAREISPRSSATQAALDFLDSVERRCDAYPGLAVGLVALAIALDLPRQGALMLWTIGRAAGQIAHVLEQREESSVLRPRARYALS